MIVRVSNGRAWLPSDKIVLPQLGCSCAVQRPLVVQSVHVEPGHSRRP